MLPRHCRTVVVSFETWPRQGYGLEGSRHRATAADAGHRVGGGRGARGGGGPAGRRKGRHAVNKSLLLRAVVFGAFYPNYFHRSPSRQMGEYDAAKELCGWDPFATVKLSGWPSEQPAKAYFHAIQKQLAPVLGRTS